MSQKWQGHNPRELNNFENDVNLAFKKSNVLPRYEYFFKLFSHLEVYSSGNFYEELKSNNILKFETNRILLVLRISIQYTALASIKNFKHKIDFLGGNTLVNTKLGKASKLLNSALFIRAGKAAICFQKSGKREKITYYRPFSKYKYSKDVENASVENAFDLGSTNSKKLLLLIRQIKYTI